MQHHRINYLLEGRSSPIACRADASGIGGVAARAGVAGVGGAAARAGAGGIGGAN